MKESPSTIRSQVAIALNAAEDKKAENTTILQMEKSSSAFTDYFLITNGNNPRQVQAIADEIELRLKQVGTYPNSVEGYKQSEWVLLDYVHFVVHVFTENARKFYDLERLWKAAKRLNAADLIPKKQLAKSLITGPASPRRKSPRIGRSASSKATDRAIRAATSRSKPLPKAKSKISKAKPKPSARSRSKRKSR